nr:LLM class F420-dependent oxidoreductase [Micromonospora sp. DSM 115978]
LQVHLSWVPGGDEDEALRIAHDQWRSNVFPPPLCWDFDHVDLFDGASAHVPASAVTEVVNVSADLSRHASWLAEYVELGFEQIYLHHVGQRLDDFIDAFGAKVLPQLRSAGTLGSAGGSA